MLPTTLDHGTRGHAKYSASARHRWSVCPGSVRLAQGLPDRPSPYAIEGTHAHELLNHCLSRMERDCSVYSGLSADVISGTDWEITDAMVEAVQVALDHVFEILDEHDDAMLYCEQAFVVPQGRVPPEECGGTCDVLIYIPSIGRLHVIDFKFGFDIVEVEENKQLGMYAAGGATWQPWNDISIAVFDEIILTIVQPRAFHPEGPVRSAPPLPVDPWVMDELHAIEDEINLCEAYDAPLVVTKAGCKWCPAAAICPALEASALATVRADFASVRQVTESALPNPSDLPVDRLAYILDAGKLLAQWLSDCHDLAFALLREGKYVPNRKLVEAQGRRRWHGEDATIADNLIALSGFELDLDDVMPRKLIPLTYAETKLKEVAKANAPRGMKKAAATQAREAMAWLTLKSSSGEYVMVPESDPRPAVNPVAVAYKGVALPPPLTEPRSEDDG